MDPEQALELLYAGRMKDLTADGYLSAIRDLRRRSPALANKVERALAPVLRTKVFPRRRIPWHETSIGMAYRTALLPDNPHVQHDVATVRRVLGIPDGQVRSRPRDPIRSMLEEWRTSLLVPVAVLADRELAGRWIEQHTRAAKGLPPNEFAEGLAPQALSAAQESARLELSSPEKPEWLRTMPPVHPRCPSTWNEGLPLHWTVASLLERHRLPHHLCGTVMVHVLTTHRQDLERTDPIGVTVAQGSSTVSIVQPQHSFSVTVDSIDEFTTQEEWKRIWLTHIKPRRQWLLGQRGQRPRGRQAPDLERLREALPLYRAWIEQGSIEDALNWLQKQEAPEGELERETARRVLKDLGDLLRPIQVGN